MKLYLTYLTKNWIFIVFLLTLILHLACATIGWNNSIADHHGFRQTHTAITAYYFIKEGFKINYITPVLGMPWSIPIEFPFYQLLTSLIAQTNLIPLDQAGRLLSLLFFYLSLLIIYKILKLIQIKRNYCFLILSLILVNPIYIFWSRTFMIESTALFFTLAYIFSCFESATNNSKNIRIYAILIGILGVLVKITTFVIALPLAVLGYYYLSRKFNNKIFTFKSLLLFLIPFALGGTWTLYADYIRSLNPIAVKYFASEVAAKWYFGDFGERTSIFIWDQIFKTVQKFVIPPLMVLLIPILVAFLKKGHKIILALILTFLLGPLFFTNMYFVHDYYLYANSVYLLVAVGLIFVFLLNSYTSKIILLFYPAILILSLWTYTQTYLPIQQNNNTSLIQLSNFINANTRQEDIILVEDHDANPEIPYYSQRKAIMLSWGSKIDDSEVQKSLDLTGREKITALVTGTDKKGFYTDHELRLLGFNKTSAFQNSYGTVYLKI